MYSFNTSLGVYRLGVDSLRVYRLGVYILAAYRLGVYSQDVNCSC